MLFVILCKSIRWSENLLRTAREKKLYLLMVFISLFVTYCIFKSESMEFGWMCDERVLGSTHTHSLCIGTHGAMSVSNEMLQKCRRETLSKRKRNRINWTHSEATGELTVITSKSILNIKNAARLNSQAKKRQSIFIIQYKLIKVLAHRTKE